MSFEEFHGGHLGYWNGTTIEIFQDGRHEYRNRTILAILNLYNSSKPLINFQLNLTYCLGLDVV